MILFPLMSTWMWFQIFTASLLSSKDTSDAPLLPRCDIGPAIECLPPRHSCAADVKPRRRVILGR